MARRPVRIGGQELPPDSPVLRQAAAAERAQYLRRRAELAPLPPVAERSAMLEGHWQKQITVLAKQLGFFVYHPKLSRWSARGWPDLSLLGDRALWIECKDDGGQLSEFQVDVIDRMIACGLEVYVLRPWHGLEYVASILQQHPDDVRMRREDRE